MHVCSGKQPYPSDSAIFLICNSRVALTGTTISYPLGPGGGGGGVGFLKIKRVLPILFNVLIAEWSGERATIDIYNKN